MNDLELWGIAVAVVALGLLAWQDILDTVSRMSDRKRLAAKRKLLASVDAFLEKGDGPRYTRLPLDLREHQLVNGKVNPKAAPLSPPLPVQTPKAKS